MKRPNDASWKTVTSIQETELEVNTPQVYEDHGAPFMRGLRPPCHLHVFAWKQPQKHKMAESSSWPQTRSEQICRVPARSCRKRVSSGFARPGSGRLGAIHLGCLFCED